jgi:hypothetical protein
METSLTEEKIVLNISLKNVPFVISALESEAEQFQAANDLAPGITLLENMVKYLKPYKPVPLPFK